METFFRMIENDLRQTPHTWLITGVAGFIGSHLLEFLLQHDQNVVGIDNYFSGYEDNVAQVKLLVTEEQWKRFRFVEGDVRDLALCQRCTQNVDYVLHQAALCSVPRSIEEPLLTNDINVNGFLSVMKASVDNKVKRVVFASSSAVYGDERRIAKQEKKTGTLLSPYAVSKRIIEMYAANFSLNYGLPSIGLRYFNVFGSRQDPDGSYAAVIPKWIAAMIHKQPVIIYGSGDQTRDFCFVSNVVQANILAALIPLYDQTHDIFNVACGLRIDLEQLFYLIRDYLAPHYSHVKDLKPVYEDKRPGDIKHSLADIVKAQTYLKYEPEILINEGLRRCVDWYRENA